jgi:hypothetical protein
MAFHYIPKYIKLQELYILFFALCIMCSALVGVLELLGDGTVRTFIWIAVMPLIVVLSAYVMARLLGPLPKGNVTCTPTITDSQITAMNNLPLQ